MKVVLISTYELGRQPFGLASPAAWLRVRAHDVVCLDLSREPLHEAAVRAADLVAPVRSMNPRAHPKLKPRTRLAPPATEDDLGMR